MLDLKELTIRFKNALDAKPFDNISKVHDWKNYIPEDIKANWSVLTPRERLLLAYQAQEVANNEEWE